MEVIASRARTTGDKPQYGRTSRTFEPPRDRHKADHDHGEVERELEAAEVEEIGLDHLESRGAILSSS